jgi:hypothetical protein
VWLGQPGLVAVVGKEDPAVQVRGSAAGRAVAFIQGALSCGLETIDVGVDLSVGPEDEDSLLAHDCLLVSGGVAGEVQRLAEVGS